LGEKLKYGLGETVIQPFVKLNEVVTKVMELKEQMFREVALP